MLGHTTNITPALQALETDCNLYSKKMVKGLDSGKSTKQSVIVIIMQNLNDDERKQVLGEVLADELKAIHELVKDVPFIKKDVETLRRDNEELKSDMKVVKAVNIDMSREQKEHDMRISHLESA